MGSEMCIRDRIRTRPGRLEAPAPVALETDQGFEDASGDAGEWGSEEEIQIHPEQLAGEGPSPPPVATLLLLLRLLLLLAIKPAQLALSAYCNRVVVAYSVCCFAVF